MPPNATDLTLVENHFQFGKNWEAFSSHINEARIKEATQSLVKFFGKEGLKGKTFFDIGCGSGLFSLAALRLGVEKVYAIDIDADSVYTTQNVLKTFHPSGNFHCEKMSVFDLDPNAQGTFDIVYSWGVLHHTGDMERAIKKAASMVKKGGVLAIALYRKTPLCNFWKVEKKFYKQAPKWVQCIARMLWYTAWFCRAIILRKNPFSYIKNYQSSRGMSFCHDVHDWLGGYPYESILPREMHTLAGNCGLKLMKEFVIPKVHLGLLGAGCDEYVFIKEKAP